MELTRGERITDLRRERNLTVEQLADIVGVSKGTISNLENDKSSNVKVDFIVQLANYFGVTTDYLLGLSEHMTEETAKLGKETGLSDDNIKWLISFNEDSSERLHNAKNKFFDILNNLLNSIRQEDIIFNLMRLSLRTKSFKKSFYKNVRQEDNTQKPDFDVYEAVTLYNEIQVIDNKRKELTDLLSSALYRIIGYDNQELHYFYDLLSSYHICYDIDVDNEDVIEHVDIEKFIENYRRNNKEGDT